MQPINNFWNIFGRHKKNLCVRLCVPLIMGVARRGPTPVSLCGCGPDVVGQSRTQPAATAEARRQRDVPTGRPAKKARAEPSREFGRMETAVSHSGGAPFGTVDYMLITFLSFFGKNELAVNFFQISYYGSGFFCVSKVLYPRIECEFERNRGARSCKKMGVIA